MDEKKESMSIELDKLNAEYQALRQVIKELPIFAITTCSHCRSMSNGGTYICVPHTEELCRVAVNLLPVLSDEFKENNNKCVLRIPSW